MKALIIGAVFVDVVVRVPELPTSGSDVTGHDQVSHVGGCAYNVYGAVRAMEGLADLFVPVGRGQFADVVRATFAAQRIPVKLDVSGSTDNGWDLAFVEPNGERSFLTLNGVEQQWQPEWFDHVELASYDCFYVNGYELEDPTTARVILAALRKRRPATPIVFDPSPRAGYLDLATVQAVLALNVIVHCNEVELAQLMPTGDSTTDKMRRLFARTHQPVVVTLGARGTCYYDGTTTKVLSGVSTPVVNTIGAGDTHCGALVAGLMAGASLGSTLEQANLLAARVVGQEKGSLL